MRGDRDREVGRTKEAEKGRESGIEEGEE